ncbi:MAG: type II toxin-antitoxin system HicA family toxin [Alphaproteobacteria bacterium]|nr:type II toxin-antitoxin system HicA family toxin [Alphaproteobacteria bacterium]
MGRRPDQRPPKLPRVSGAEVVRALERLGFSKVRQSGSHLVMRRGAKGCVVPMHAELKVGTLAGVLRQAEVTAEDFAAALRG